MVWAMIDGGDLPLEPVAHPIHQQLECRFAIVTAPDSRLISCDDYREIALRKCLYHLEDAVDEHAVFNPMQISGSNVDDAVPVEKESASFHCIKRLNSAGSSICARSK